MHAELIRVRGLVQGVGFRPTVWRLAHAFMLVGDVLNDGEGVLIRVQSSPRAPAATIDDFCAALLQQCPPLARIDTIERTRLARALPTEGFSILNSTATVVRTAIVPDATTCPACAAEIADPTDRRHRYPFTNCTHCGPRLSIVKGIPYDRARTSMALFTMCPTCQREYADPGERRFHAQPNACADCGPRPWLIDAQGVRLEPADCADTDVIATASRLLAQGRILAIKGIGGFHLVCDAANTASVAELRRRKRRFAKPFALMATSLDVIRDYCRIGAPEAALLSSPAAPILLLESLRSPARALAAEIAPGQSTLGFMLPYSPLHLLLLAGWDRPLVMTSGNLSEAPQCIDNAEALRRLNALADFTLLHDREIANRVDDSVARMMAGAPRLLRRARGYAPAPIMLPSGFAKAPALLALGGELNNTFCLLRDGEAILSQHLGDLEEAHTARAFETTLALYLDLFQHSPRMLAVDLHPDYRSTLIGRERARRDGLALIGVQHHHAHLASTLAENAWALDAGPVLGIVLDGLGYGEDGTLWGGEFLMGEYARYRRLGGLKPVALPGGTQAILQPWRNLFAQLEAACGWETMRTRHPDLEILKELSQRPLGVLRTMIERGVNTPLSSSAGRLFDAAAAALGLSAERVSYAGQAAIELEALATGVTDTVSSAYPLGSSMTASGIRLDPAPLWDALFADLARGVARERIAARFHAGLAASIVRLGRELATRHGLTTVALSGGVFQNRILLEAVYAGFTDAGLSVLMQRQVPSNDGGLSLGQASVAAARALSADS